VHFVKDYNIPGAEIALEDSIMQKGEPVSAGSKILENYVSPINATVADRLNGKIAGRTAMNEFGISGIYESESVLGAVEAVADGTVKYSLCNDVFGDYRRQAAEKNCGYIRPTYGTVSRYGLIPLVSSMDQIGIVCKNPDEGFKLLECIAGNDANDGAMFPEEKYSYDKAGKAVKDIIAGIPEYALDMADSGDRETIRGFVKKFKAVDIELDYFNVYKQVMYILCCAEISGNISRYDGIKYGRRALEHKGVNDLYVKTRTEGLGMETKLAAIMGAMSLSSDKYGKYYEKAMKLRRLIKETCKFDEYDIIVLPCKIGGNRYENLSLYALGPLAGLPSVSFSYKGCGIQLIADVKNEALLKAAWGAANEI
jgi:aspartyl-tRNA(Asn)/glutamyl-tRNA(Gln) amidotransferase subunit A